MTSTALAPLGGAQPLLRAQNLRVALVWGTNVLAVKLLKRGEHARFGDDAGALAPMPDGLVLPEAPLRALPSGWELDPRGATGGALLVRGRAEDPAALGRAGLPVPVMPGDHGLLQYGAISVFFQYTQGVPLLAGRRVPDVLVGLALVSSLVLHGGVLGMLRTLMTPPAIPKPLELESDDGLAARFGLSRPLAEDPPPAAGEDPGGGKAAGAEAPKPDPKAGGGRKIKGDEGKLGFKDRAGETRLSGDPKPTTHLGGLAEVLDGQTGKEIQSTLKSIDSVSSVLSGMNASNVQLGGGSGTGLKHGGAGGGGTGAGVAYGSGNLDTGLGPGKGGGVGSGAGGAGGRGGGNGGGSGGGGAPGESRVAVASGNVQAGGGLTPEQVRRVVVAHQNALRACYELEAQKNPNLKGGLTVAWQIEPSGSTGGSARVVQSSLGSPRVEGCVVRQVASWRFPASDRATPVTFPFKFGVGG